VRFEARVGEAQHGADLFRRHVKHFRDLVKRHSGFEILKHGLNRHARAPKDPSTADLAGPQALLGEKGSGALDGMLAGRPEQKSK
jgi:hypothetical protein